MLLAFEWVRIKSLSYCSTCIDNTVRSWSLQKWPVYYKTDASFFLPLCPNREEFLWRPSFQQLNVQFKDVHIHRLGFVCKEKLKVKIKFTQDRMKDMLKLTRRTKLFWFIPTFFFIFDCYGCYYRRNISASYLLAIFRFSLFWLYSPTSLIRGPATSIISYYFFLVLKSPLVLWVAMSTALHIVYNFPQ